MVFSKKKKSKEEGSASSSTKAANDVDSGGADELDAVPDDEPRKKMPKKFASGSSSQRSRDLLDPNKPLHLQVGRAGQGFRAGVGKGVCSEVIVSGLLLWAKTLMPFDTVLVLV